MTSLVTQMIIAEQHGIRLNVEQLAKLLSMTAGSIRNQLSAGTFPIPTYVDNNKRWADYRDVAAHLDAKREEAHRLAA